MKTVTKIRRVWDRRSNQHNEGQIIYHGARIIPVVIFTPDEAREGFFQLKAFIRGAGEGYREAAKGERDETSQNY